MSKNYFVVERVGKYAEHINIVDNNGDIVFGDIMDLSYNELKRYDRLDEFVASVNSIADDYFGDTEGSTAVTLVGSDDIFIWSIIIGAEQESDILRYSLIDWLSDGKKYRYITE